MPSILDYHIRPGFYGRLNEYQRVRELLLQPNRCGMLVHGPAGMGKTALVSQVASKLAGRYRSVYAFDFANGPCPIEKMVWQLCLCFEQDGMKPPPQFMPLPSSPEKIAQHLAQVLNQWPTLLVFDNIESRLRPEEGGERIADENLSAFFNALLKANPYGSHFVFISRTPLVLEADLETLQLGELSQTDAIGLLQTLPRLASVSFEEAEIAYQFFGGYPFALVGLDRYCSHHLLLQAFQEAATLQSNQPELLAVELNYAQLSERSQEMLCRLSAYGTLVPPEAASWSLREDPSLTPDDFAQSISELISWGLLTLISDNDQIKLLSVHPLVRDFCREQQMHEMWRSRRRDVAAFHIIQMTKLQQESQTPEAAWHQIEAFELLIETDNYEDVAKLVLQSHSLLTRWGLSQHVETQYRRLLDKVSLPMEAALRHNLAALLQEREEIAPALQQYQIALKISEGMEDRAGMARSLYNIGHLQQASGEWAMALQQFQFALKLSEELDDWTGLALALHQIGRIHQDRGEYSAAIQQYLRALTLFEELDDKGSQARTLHNIGRIHQDRGERAAAMQQYQRSLKIFEELGDPSGMARLQHSIGRIHQDCNEYTAAFQQFQLSLKLFEELNDRASMASALHNLGRIHQDRGEYEMALQQYQLSLNSFEALKDRAGAASVLHQIGRIRQERGEYEVALQSYEQSRDIFEDLGDQNGLAMSHGQVGQLFTQLGLYPKSFKHLLLALVTFVKLESPHTITAVDALRALRSKWSAEEFDATWQRVTGETVPEWLA